MASSPITPDANSWAHWRFNDDYNATVFADSSGNGRDLTRRGTATSLNGGWYDGAVALAGTAGDRTLTGSPSGDPETSEQAMFKAGNYTVEIVFSAAANFPGARLFSVAGSTEAESNNCQISLLVAHDNFWANWEYSLGVDVAHEVGSGNIEVTALTPHYGVVVVETDSDTGLRRVTLQFDELSDVVSDWMQPATLSSGSSPEFTVGSLNSSGGSSPFYGAIEEIHVSNVAR